MLRREGRADPEADPCHTPPYVQAKEYIRVRATVRGLAVDDAVVLGWCGQDVYITWRSDMGRHLGWVPAADVERLEAAGVDLLTDVSG